MGNMKDNKIVFKIIKNKNGKDFDKKIKGLKKEFKNNKNIDIKTYKKSLAPKKKNADLFPSSLKQSSVNSHLYIKNRNVDKALQEKTYLKPLENKNNNEQKVTKIFVNLKYKNRMNLPQLKLYRLINF